MKVCNYESLILAKGVTMISQSFIEKFKVPETAYPYLEQIFTKVEIDFISNIEKDTFTASDIEELGLGQAEEFIQSSYKRGIISLADEKSERYKLSDFYGRLDIFSISETDTYRSFPKEGREALDNWYFDAYYNGLSQDKNVRPTSDVIMPLKEVLAFIEEQDRPVYLNFCDCRSLKGDCGLPTRTCITYKNGINSFAHRGLSERIDKETAKEIVRKADKDGLMHTVNPNGICNCCEDCCYLFRGQKRRDSLGFWPETNYVINLDNNSCISCGKCIRTCHFDVFTKGSKVQADLSKCVGCGICVEGCPTKSLKLNKRQGYTE